MSKEIEFFGSIVKGFGKGKYFLSLKQYREQFISKLGFDPYPGTLNISLDESYLKNREELKKLKPIIINGFVHKKTKYGKVECYKAKINDINGAIIIPEKTNHEEKIIEFISPKNILESLKLVYGDKVIIKVISYEEDDKY